MENISIHAAALEAIEWFHLDPTEMSAAEPGEEHADESAPGETEAKPKPVAKKPAQVAEKTMPNTPLKFRLDKLEREHPYLIKERGLLLETIVDFGIGFCAKGMMANRIAIPIHNPDGNVVAYAGRWPGEPAEDTPKYKLPQGFRKSLEVFNIDRAIKDSTDNPLIIVEGFFDCMKIHQAGWHKVVALMGATMSAAQEELIRKHTARNAHVIVMLDENEAGRAGREDIACRLSKHCFIKIHEFDTPDAEPEYLTSTELRAILEDTL
jgi:DNA primase